MRTLGDFIVEVSALLADRRSLPGSQWCFAMDLLLEEAERILDYEDFAHLMHITRWGPIPPHEGWAA
ncbi:hypothetical protein ASD30_25110 [Nocardioides sp. Root140]|nr:hypothetical protein ASD30_25110 [Nocardioides sp. Root140]